jgi:hypothetical protein
MEPSLLKSWPDDARSLLLDSVPWSPFDFIKGISTDGDRAVHVASLVRDIAPADDMRFAYPLTADTDVAVCAERLPWDSEFFGYDIAKVHGMFPLRKDGYRADADYTGAVRALTELARSRGIRYLFGVIDSRDLPTSRALTGCGFSLIETRLHCHLSLRTYEHPRRFRCRLATAADVDCLTALARTIENPYDRFTADPFIDRNDTLRLMETWIRASLLQGYADATFITDTQTPGALCTVKYHKDRVAAWKTSIAQLVLAMAAPRAGNGFLGVISELSYYLKGLGIDHVMYSTQIANRSISRVGQHLGFTYGKGEYVFRLVLPT